MSRLGSTFSKHRKDNYSLDIKGLYKSSIPQTPFAKKKDKEDSFILKLRTQAAHYSSMQSSDKEIGMRQRRRLSLSKTFKINNSVGVETHLMKEKLNRVHQLMAEHKYEDSLIILRQLISKEENSAIRGKLCWLNSICLLRIGKMKEAEQFLTKYLNYEPDNYEAIVERAKIRYNMGSKEVSIRDLKHAIKLEPLQSKAHLELCNLYLEEGNKKESFAVASFALEKGIDSTELLLNVVELLLTSPNIFVSSEGKAVELVQKLREQIGHDSKDSADILYLEALLLESKQKWSEACIYYEECLKYNNSKFSVTKSLERLILIKIDQRDYYSAYHTVNRYKILNIETKYINPYMIFLEGVILIMKKKFNDGCKLFDNFIEAIEIQGTGKSVTFQSQFLEANDEFIKKGKPITIKIPFQCKSVILPLLLKFNAYASYKLGKHEKSIQYYEKLTPWGLDECSSYNKLLAEGIIACEKQRNFQLAMEKFEQGSYVYPCKVEPSIYLAMTVIYRDLCLNEPEESNRIETESLTSAVIHAIEEMNEAHESINDSSSNLLFHRCILNLYLEDWENAQNDINLCIEKAEENEPKYFYLRGLTYAVVKDLRKAINEYSISLSLDPEYIQSLLERAKCYFLLGETEIGFSDLKQYMYKNPTDHKVHKWIGDLLYEGKSYNDALKAYEEIDETIFEVEIMKCKCLMRVADIQKISECLNRISKVEKCNENKIQVDILAVGLIKLLIRPHDQKETVSKIKKLNSFLEENKTGYMFDLIDCMNLLGLATLQASKYEESYESFLLVLELYTTLAIKNKSDLKSDFSEESLSLHLEDVYFNITACLLGMKDYVAAAKMMKEELIPLVKGEALAKFLVTLADKLEKNDNPLESCQLEGSLKKNEKIKLKQFEFKAKGLKIKYLPTFSIFHSSVDDLYSRNIARRIVKDLKPSYIDNMPEGPWIKRNEHGVIFTDQIIEDDGSSAFLSSMKAKESQEASYQNSQRDQEYSDKNQIEDFKKKMQFDSQLEKKLNSIIEKTQREV